MLGYARLRWASLGLRDLEAVKYLLFYITAVSLYLQKFYRIDVGARACLVHNIYHFGCTKAYSNAVIHY